VVLVTRSHKNPQRKPARELPCGKIRILLRNHYLINFIYELKIHGSFIKLLFWLYFEYRTPINDF